MIRPDVELVPVEANAEAPRPDHPEDEVDGRHAAEPDEDADSDQGVRRLVNELCQSMNTAPPSRPELSRLEQADPTVSGRPERSSAANPARPETSAAATAI